MKNTEWLTRTAIAHRGLHDNKTVPENSMAAFGLAADAGYGIETDVYLTADGELILHHDPSLRRTCGIKTSAVKIDGKNLQNYKLMGTEEHVPLFRDFLALVAGRVGIVVEIKTTSRVEETCKAVYDVLQNYDGNYCIESFQPTVVRWWAKHHPETVLGQLYDPNPLHRGLMRVMRQYRYIDFLAVCIKNLPNAYFEKIAELFPDKLIVAWTVRTSAQLELAEKYADNFIFESNRKNPDYIAPPEIRNPS